MGKPPRVGRPAEVVALRRLALEALENRQLLTGLHALGDDRQPECVRCLDDQPKQLVRRGHRRVEEPSVDLHDVHRQVFEPG